MYIKAPFREDFLSMNFTQMDAFTDCWMISRNKILFKKSKWIEVG